MQPITNLSEGSGYAGAYQHIYLILHMHLTWMNPPAPCSLFILFISIPCLFVDDERKRKVINSAPNVTAFFIESWKVEKQESVWFGCHKTCAGGCNCRKWKRGSFKVEMKCPLCILITFVIYIPSARSWVRMRSAWNVEYKEASGFLTTFSFNGTKSC